MKALFTIALSLLAFGSVLAQPGVKSPIKGPAIQWEKTNHDFGDVKEELGSVSVEYKFTNVGDSDLVLTKVQPACGCTTPTYSKDPVKPGQSGSILAKFDVMHRHGRQDKSISINTNEKKSFHLLTFSANVIPRPRTWKDTFTQQVGPLHFSTTAFVIGNISKGAKDTVGSVKVYNSTDKPVTLTSMSSTAQYAKAVKLPVTIQPGQRMELQIMVTPSKFDDYGPIFNEVLYKTDDPMDSKGIKLTVFADVKPATKKYSDKDKHKAPVFTAEKKVHDFGSVKQGEEVFAEFTFKNTGVDELEIFKVKPSCGCTSSQPDKSKLKKGESSKIRISFNSAGMKGAQTKNVTVYSNDPASPATVLSFKADVKTPAEFDMGNATKPATPVAPGSKH